MAHLIAARRSAVVPRNGAFVRLTIEELGVPVALACLAQAGVDAGEVDEVILSNALGAGGNPARRVALAAGLPDAVGGLTIDRQCAGGLDAILIARAMVDSGAARVILAGGVESYSRRPLRLATDPEGGPPIPYDEAPFTPWPDRNPGMAEAADALARRLGISRATQEAWAVDSHRKAVGADLSDEIIPILDQYHDAFTRRLSPALASRAPVVTGCITAATAAVAADGAAFVLVVSDSVAHRFHRSLRIVGGVTLGADPMEPGLAPVAAILQVLGTIPPAHLGMAEVMEAYAVQAIATVAAAGIDPAVVNPGGGALARGHPVGASGAILAVRLFHGLRQGLGLAAIAAAGGIGTALLVEASGA